MMTDWKPSAKQLELTAKALRFTIWQMDVSAWRASGADPADMPPCPVADAELAALAAPLAALAISARCALAENTGIKGPEAQASAAHAFLLNELESYEVNAALAAVEAEMKGGG